MYLQCVQNTTPYQVEQYHRKIALLRTKQSIIIARLHHFVPRGTILSQDCTTSYQGEQFRRTIVLLGTTWSKTNHEIVLLGIRGAE